MNKAYSLFLGLFVFGMILASMPVQAVVATTPMKAKHTFTGATLTAFDSDYDARDFLIASGNQLDLDKVTAGLILPDDVCSVNLAETSLKSDPAIDSESDFSSTFVNNTYDNAVESTDANVAVDSQLTSSYGNTRMGATVRFNTSGAETATWTSYMATDSNEDGDYEDSADRHWRTSIGGSGQVLYWNALADWNVTDTDNFMSITWSFETVGANDYDVIIIFMTGSGDSAWSGISSSADNSITLTLYDTDNQAIALGMSLQELDQMDLGDSPVISGLDEIIVQVGTDNANAEVDVRINNFCVFTEIPSITDGTDNDDDWDLNGATGGLWSGAGDDNDFLVTSVTEGATEAYDSEVALYNKIETSPYAMPQDAKIITFTGNMYYYPQEWSVSSVSKSGYYETTELWTFDTTAINDLKTPSNVIAWTDTIYNMTLSQEVLYNSYEDFEDDLLSFELEGTDETEELRALWDSANDDNYKVAYDGTNPDTSTGSSYDFELIYNSDSAWEDEGGVAVTPSGDNTMMIIGIGFIVILALLGIYLYASSDDRKPKRRRKRN